MSRPLTLLALLSPLLLAGCGATQRASPTPVSSDIQGEAHGGRQPVAGAHIYLFAAATSAYGDPSLPLIQPGTPGVAVDATGPYILTDASGAFSLAHVYACTPGQQVYLLATGGNPGLPSGTLNRALALMTVLGPCPPDGNLSHNTPFLFINEVTTVATVYALAGFMADPTHVASSPTGATGLANAFATVRNLADPSTGVAALHNAQDNADVPQDKINTLANLLVACVNSDGTASPCATLFSSALGGARQPAETATAALNVARNPSANVAALFSLAGSNPPFQPALSSAPNDWTLALTFYANNFAGPYFPAVDSSGNLWVPAYASDTLTQFDPTGNIINQVSSSLHQPFSVAIDANDGPWVVNFAPLGASTVARFHPDGGAVDQPYPCSSACFFGAFDTHQNLWISGATRTTVLQFSGSSLAQFPTNAYTSGIALDPANNAWTISQPRTLSRLTLPSASTNFAEPVTTASGTELTPIALDASSNIWFVSNRNNAIGESSPAGTLISPSTGYTGGGLNSPSGIAIDGAGIVWVANRAGNSISAFSPSGTPLTPSTGLQAPGLSQPRGPVIDPSGNLWVTNFTYNSITEFIGLATPTATPITPTNHAQRP